jgi:hypothetical protein
LLPALTFSFFWVPSVLANGGPINWSNTIGTGSFSYQARKEVLLSREELTIRPGFSHVNVEAVYLLSNTGEPMSVDFAFPVDLMVSEYEFDQGIRIANEVPVFVMFLDGTPLEVLQLIGFQTGSEENEFGEQQDTHTAYFATSFILPGYSTAELRAEYTFKAWFTDFETTKDYFPSQSGRKFRYSLHPAGYWGRGEVGNLDITLDFTEIFSNGGSAVSVPEGGSWESGLYSLALRNFDLLSAMPLEVEYEVCAWGVSNAIAHRSLPAEEITLNASSTLPPSGETTYSVRNLLDGDPSTAWAEGAPGVAGEWIEFFIDPPLTMGFVGIIPGYAKSAALYYANARPRTVTIVIDDRLPETVVLDDLSWEDIESGQLGRMVQPLINSGGNIPDARRISIRFDDAYPGELYDDLCVSELLVAGWRWSD